jgi:cation transport protein ChaC
MRAETLLDPDGHLYVFAYGSLLWRPGFRAAGGHPALLRGWHRRFCIVSCHHRGTPERPGLVLGLDRGGACRGWAWRVAAPDAAEVLAYLDGRELVGGEYVRRVLPVTLLDSGARKRALTYVADRAAPFYARALSPEETATRIAGARGIFGENRDYLHATARHLAALGVRDAAVQRVAALLPPPEEA